MIIGFGQIIVCANLPFGVAAGILALMGKNAWEAGDAEGAKKKVKISKILGIIGIVLSFIGFFAAIAIPAFVGYLEASRAAAY